MCLTFKAHLVVQMEIQLLNVLSVALLIKVMSFWGKFISYFNICTSKTSRKLTKQQESGRFSSPLEPAGRHESTRCIHKVGIIDCIYDRNM